MAKRTKRESKHTDASEKKMVELAKKHKLTKASDRITKKGKRVGGSVDLQVRRR